MSHFAALATCSTLIALAMGCASQSPLPDTYAPFSRLSRERQYVVPHTGDYVVAWIDAAGGVNDIPATRRRFAEADVFGFMEAGAGQDIIAIAGTEQLLLDGIPPGTPTVAWRRVVDPAAPRSLGDGFREMWYHVAGSIRPPVEADICNDTTAFGSDTAGQQTTAKDCDDDHRHRRHGNDRDRDCDDDRRDRKR